MKKRRNIKTLSLASMFLTLALILPFFTGQIPQIGSMLCPMHIPVLLCGFFCGGSWGFVVGLIAPLLRSFIFAMPPMFPTAVCMAFELATYGFIAGILHNKLAKKKWMVYVSLISAMVTGRLVWGLAMLACMGFDTAKFGMVTFLSGAVISAIPGIILQLVLIPVMVITLERVVNRDKQIEFFAKI